MYEGVFYFHLPKLPLQTTSNNKPTFDCRSYTIFRFKFFWHCESLLPYGPLVKLWPLAFGFCLSKFPPLGIRSRERPSCTSTRLPLPWSHPQASAAAAALGPLQRPHLLLTANPLSLLRPHRRVPSVTTNTQIPGSLICLPPSLSLRIYMCIHSYGSIFPMSKVLTLTWNLRVLFWWRFLTGRSSFSIGSVVL